MLTVTGLSKRYDRLTVMDRFDLSVPTNGFTVMVGPSGCGKSTFFDLLTGVQTPDTGKIFWQGTELSHLGDQAAYMQQKDLLLPWLSLLDNALLPCRIAGKDGSESRRRAAELFHRLELNGFETYRPSQVSGGMRQRCALVRTLMFGRDLVLLDEPLSALDAITRRSLQRLLLMLQNDFGRTLLMITHDIEEALHLADEVVVVTAAPMRIRERYPLGGPKPRSMHDKGLLALKEHVFERLQGELAHAPQ